MAIWPGRVLVRPGVGGYPAGAVCRGYPGASGPLRRRAIAPSSIRTQGPKACGNPCNCCAGAVR